LVISIEGESLVDKTADDANEIMHRLERRKEGPLHMVVEGIDGVRELDLYSLPACNYPIVLVESDLVNAFADGTRIVVTTAMLDFCANETELALVIGHEIAHNALGHADDVRLRRVLDALSASQSGYRQELVATATQFSFSRDFETAADYVGLYLAARAKHDIRRVGPFWMRLSQRTSVTTPAFAITHPSFPERFTSFQTTLREIKTKKNRGEPLSPAITFAHPERPRAQP
jgi:predicted Zn-dependent protease